MSGSHSASTQQGHIPTYTGVLPTSAPPNATGSAPDTSSAKLEAVREQRRLPAGRRYRAELVALHRMGASYPRAYLEERALSVRQKTLDQDRQALQILPLIGKPENVG